jgi:RNA polymerase sigma-70 factor, ECF subfamily
MDALERFAGGDADAFETLFRQYQGEVYAWIVRIVRQPAAAEDLTVETFWRIYQHRSRFDASRPFGPWARRIATRVAIDYLRSAQRSFVEPAESLAQPARPDPLRERELRAQIERAFCSLPPKLRAAATLALVEERPYHEIADGLGISLSAVKMRVARAVRRLRANLEEMGIRP